MAILLKELTIRYSPQGGDLMQLIKDYFAVFGLWQKHQQPGAASESKVEMINDVMHQVGKMTHQRMIQRLGEMDLSQKEGINKIIAQFNHASSMEDWTEFTSALNDLARLTSNRTRVGDFAKVWKDASVADVSPSIWNLFGGRPKKPEPVGVKPWDGLGKDPSKAFNKPLTAPPAEIPRELPMAGAQMHLPLKPREKLPPMPSNLPPLATRPEGPTRLVTWEPVLTSFGYVWDEGNKVYRNDQRNVTLQVDGRTNSIKATFPSGKKKDYPNIGTLLRAMGHSKTKRHARKAGEPQAQVTEENYKALYEFLYT